MTQPNPSVSAPADVATLKAIHSTTWEDAQMAGVNCDGKYVGTITAYEREPWVCERCGAILRLVWDVRLEEVRTDVR